MGKNDKNNAFLPNIDALIKMGINPKTGLPYKFLSNIKLKENIMTVLRVVDEQDAVNRGKWYNLPCNITSQDLERMLYYKGREYFLKVAEITVAHSFDVSLYACSSRCVYNALS